MAKRSFQLATFSDDPSRLAETKQVADALGISFAEAVRRSLVLALPKLRASARHVVGVERDEEQEAR